MDDERLLPVFGEWTIMPTTGRPLGWVIYSPFDRPGEGQRISTAELAVLHRAATTRLVQAGALPPAPLLEYRDV